MSFTGTQRTPEHHAMMRADTDLRLTGEDVLARWLTEFGYMHGAENDLRVAFRRARIERGPVRLAAEMAAYEKRIGLKYPFRRERCPHGTAVNNHCRDCD